MARKRRTDAASTCVEDVANKRTSQMTIVAVQDKTFHITSGIYIPESSKIVKCRCSCLKINQVHSTLKTYQRDAISATAFRNLLFVPKMELHNQLFTALIHAWDKTWKAFKLGEKWVSFTVYDVALALGLPVTGTIIDIHKDYGAYDVAGIIEAELNSNDSSKSYVAAIERCMARYDQEDQLNTWMKLYLAYIFSVLLFPRSKYGVSGGLLPLTNDLVAMSQYAWGRAVYDHLISSLNDWKDNDRTYACGCLVVLQVWYLEHTNAEFPPPPRSFPRICKWAIPARPKYDDVRRVMLTTLGSSIKLVLEVSEEELNDDFVSAFANTEEYKTYLEEAMASPEVVLHRQRLQLEQMHGQLHSSNLRNLELEAENASLRHMVEQLNHEISVLKHTQLLSTTQGEGELDGNAHVEGVPAHKEGVLAMGEDVLILPE